MALQQLQINPLGRLIVMRKIHHTDLAQVFTLARSDFATLKGARVLVTGATGFVGSWLVESAAYANREGGLGLRLFALVPPWLDLANAGAHLVGLDGVTFLRGDIRTLERGALEQQDSDAGAFDAVIHAAIAVDATTIATNPMPTLDTAVEGTRRALEVARASGASRFLFLSSGAVYGAAPAHLQRIPETYLGGPDQTDPRAVYAEGKRIGEMMCACAKRAHGLATVMARPFAFVGPHLPIDRHFAIGNFVRDALVGGPVVVQSDGTSVRSYMYAGDMAVWLWALLVRGESGRAYNVGASRDVTIAEVARLVAAAANPTCSVEVRGQPRSGAVADRYLPDVSRARETLGLTETVGLEDAIARTFRWHQGAR
jgi:dTDP-glucose 4,6-dehydratase